MPIIGMPLAIVVESGELHDDVLAERTPMSFGRPELRDETWQQFIGPGIEKLRSLVWRRFRCHLVFEWESLFSEIEAINQAHVVEEFDCRFAVLFGGFDSDYGLDARKELDSIDRKALHELLSLTIHSFMIEYDRATALKRYAPQNEELISSNVILFRPHLQERRQKDVCGSSCEPSVLLSQSYLIRAKTAKDILATSLELHHRSARSHFVPYALLKLKTSDDFAELMKLESVSIFIEDLHLLSESELGLLKEFLLNKEVFKGPEILAGLLVGEASDILDTRGRIDPGLRILFAEISLKS